MSDARKLLREIKKDLAARHVDVTNYEPGKKRAFITVRNEDGKQVRLPFPITYNGGQSRSLIVSETMRALRAS